MSLSRFERGRALRGLRRLGSLGLGIATGEVQGASRSFYEDVVDRRETGLEKRKIMMLRSFLAVSFLVENSQSGTETSSMC